MRTSNIELQTPKIEVSSEPGRLPNLLRRWTLNVGRSTFAFLPRFLTVLCLALLLIGCGGPGIPVVVSPVDSEKRAEVIFTRAYYEPTQSGEDQIVLVADPVDEPLNAKPGEPIPPAKGPPLWQVLHIDLHWRNAASGNPDSPVASNASLNWYVYGNPTGTAAGFLHYAGPGSARVSTDSTGATVEVQSDIMELQEQHGQLRNPFTTFRISSRFHALTDPARLHKVMEEVAKARKDAEGSLQAVPPTSSPRSQPASAPN